MCSSLKISQDTGTVYSERKATAKRGIKYFLGTYQLNNTYTTKTMSNNSYLFSFGFFHIIIPNPIGMFFWVTAPL